ncbi:hypothetical protein [Paludisphaera rhizosphaerae]|uniref:hypothetical protein n=1 Tax=Paludisphaera rhizosphaerae TaxID=2711216 RepID=UPI0013EB10F6|nr:hypothetical protein [Paludisphaera rhizosphaerae]
MDFWHDYGIEFPVKTAVCQELSPIVKRFGGLLVESVKTVVDFLRLYVIAKMNRGGSVVSVRSQIHPVSADA